MFEQCLSSRDESEMRWEFVCMRACVSVLSVCSVCTSIPLTQSSGDTPVLHCVGESQVTPASERSEEQGENQGHPGLVALWLHGQTGFHDVNEEVHLV